MTFSRRTAHDTTPNALAVALASRRARGLPLVDLAASNPTTAGLPYDEAALREALADARSLAYAPEPFGLCAAREAVAEDVRAHDGVAIDPSRVVLTSSTSEAYARLFELLCDPGDEVLVPRPSYPLLDHLARLSSVTLVGYPLRHDGAWHVDLHALRAAVTTRTRAIVVVSPNNPTGHYLSRGDRDALAALGLPLIVDEVFARYPRVPHDASRAAAAAAHDDVLTFALSGLSKRALLPQLKLAWTLVSGPRAERDDALARLELSCDTFLSPSAPPMVGLPRLFDATRAATAALRTRLGTNLDTLRAALGPSSPATLLAPDGGWYAVLRLPTTRSEDAWCLGLLEEEGVHVQPGYFFDFEREAYLVVSLLPREAELAEGARRIAAYVEKTA